MNGISYFDAHCDTISCCEKLGWSLRENKGHLDLARLGEFDRAAQVFAIFHDLEKAPADGMFAECRRQAEVFRRELAENAALAAPCRTAEDVRRANGEGKVAALLSCEGSELLDCDPEKLDWAREAGVRFINLTWNHANFLSGSNASEPERGLNDLGRAFVRRAQELDIRIDVSHCSDAAFWDLMDMTQGKVVATHSDARALCGSARNLTDDMFRAIVENGGFVGLNAYAEFVREDGEARMDDFLRHFDHFLELGGAKHVGFGLDLDGCDVLAGGIRGVQDVPTICEALRRHGYDDALLEDIFYNNLLCVLE